MKKKAFLVGNTGFSLLNFRLPLMKFLRDQGWSVTAVANDEADFASKFTKEGIRFIDMPIDHKGKNPIRDIGLIWRLKQLYKKEKPDLLHHFTIKPIIFGSLAAKLANVSSIVNTITGLGYVFKKGGFLMNLVKRLYRFALSGKPIVIFQNRDDYQLFIYNNLVRKANARIILGSGVNTEILKPTINGRANGRLRFLVVSRMLWSKGVREYVNAAEKIKKQFPDTIFIMAGGASGGGARGNPDAIPEKWLNDVNNEENVKWVGRIPFEEVMALMDKSDIIVLPSYYPEGLPRSLLEAASKGKPLITTDTPGCREAVVDGVNGFLIPPKDVNSIADCMLKFIQNPNLIKKMGTESRKRAVELFDEKIVFQQTVLIYKEAGVL